MLPYIKERKGHFESFLPNLMSVCLKQAKIQRSIFKANNVDTAASARREHSLKF